MRRGHRRCAFLPVVSRVPSLSCAGSSRHARANRRLTSEIRFVILASDGLWQCVSSQEAVELAAHALDTNGTVHDAAYNLLFEACERWSKDGTICDDVTVVVILLDASRLPASVASSEPDSAIATRVGRTLTCVV